MKTALFLIAIMPNGTERIFDVPEPFLEAPTCEENRTALERDPLVSSYASAFGAEVRFECRAVGKPEPIVVVTEAPCNKPASFDTRPDLVGPCEHPCGVLEWSAPIETVGPPHLTRGPDR